MRCYLGLSPTIIYVSHKRLSIYYSGKEYKIRIMKYLTNLTLLVIVKIHMNNGEDG